MNYLPVFMKTLPTQDIIEQLKELTETEHDSDLAKILDIDKQSIYQYKQKSNDDIQQKIITLLLSKYNDHRKV
jgi:hypothetical protein